MELNFGGILYIDVVLFIVFIEKREVKCIRGYYGKLKCLKFLFILLLIKIKLKRCYVVLFYCNRYV